MNNILVIFHNNDFDGHCSAAIVGLKHNYQVDFYPIDYGDEFDYNSLKDKDIVYMLDFSLPMNQMQKIYYTIKENHQYIDKIGKFDALKEKNWKFIWIDHHVSAFKSYEAMLDDTWPNEVNFEGLRDKTGKKSGCELTWEYLYPNKMMPYVIQLLGRYDVWDHSNPDVVPFQYGLLEYEPDLLFKNLNLKICHNDQVLYRWRDLFSSISKMNFKKLNVLDIIKNGNHILNYQKSQFKKMYPTAYVIINFHNYNALVINTSNFNSMMLENHPDLEFVDILIGYYIKDDWINVSLRSNGPIDCSEIAKKYGGGGHKNAAGFRTKKFLNINLDN